MFNTLRPRQNGRPFAEDIFKCIFLNENASIAIKVSLKFIPRGPNNNIAALVQVMDWRRPGDKPLSEPMMVSLPTPICVTRPQWVKYLNPNSMTHNLFMEYITMFSPGVEIACRSKTGSHSNYFPNAMDTGYYWKSQGTGIHEVFNPLPPLSFYFHPQRKFCFHLCLYRGVCRNWYSRNIVDKFQITIWAQTILI